MDIKIYADHAATTALSPAAYEAMLPWLQDKFGNPSTLYSLARDPRKAVTRSREVIAAAINADPSEIFFTSGGTEADNWALKGLMFQHDRGKGMISSAIEHHAILNSCVALKRMGYAVDMLPVDQMGIVQAETLRSALTDNILLVSIMLANNEIGTIEPVEELAEIAHQGGALFHTDAVQAIGHIPVDVKAIDADMLSASAHKFNGPKGIGFLYAKKGIPLTNLIEGGAQERGKRAGTENVPEIVAMAAALEEASSKIEENAAHMKAMRDRLIEGLSEIPHSALNGDAVKRLPGNVNFCFEGIEGESLLLLLDDRGICASSGSACTSGSLDPSHVLLAIGRVHDVAHGSLRLSIGEDITKEETEYIIKNVREVVEYLRSFSPVWRDLMSGKAQFIL